MYLNLHDSMLENGGCQEKSASCRPCLYESRMLADMLNTQRRYGKELLSAHP